MDQEHLSILVVDDDEAVRLYLSTILRKNGYAVLEAPDGAVAVSILRERSTGIAAVLSDVRMPRIDGLELAELNYQDGFLPFIACTMVSDASMAFKFLKYGVCDYVVKPVEEAALLTTVRNAIERRKLPRLFVDDETPLPGNLGIITIPARLAAIHRARAWLELKASGIMTPDEMRRFITFVAEFLMNAYEHGSLKLTEDEKSDLLESGRYYAELRRRELDCGLKIDVAVSVVGNEIAVSVADGGGGFDYQRYLRMSEPEMLDRIVMPNGRGIQMAMQYFDGVTFNKGGAGVILSKKTR